MRVAVPLFGQDVAPRFGFADSFLIADISPAGAHLSNQVICLVGGWATRLNGLRALNVRVLLCGGFNRTFIPLAQNMGIQVHAGCAGDARRVVERFANGDSMPNDAWDVKRNRRCELGHRERKRSRGNRRD